MNKPAVSNGQLEEIKRRSRLADMVDVKTVEKLIKTVEYYRDAYESCAFYKPKSQSRTAAGCSKCGGIILADTEDWVSPLCNAHYEEIERQIQGGSKE